jgi:hypothetical protein
MAKPSLVTAARRLPCLSVVIVAAALFAATFGVSQASASYVNFCGGQYTPAHGWCYWGGAYSWRYVEADYYGAGSFQVCAALNNYFTRTTRVKDCRTDGFAAACYFGGDSALDPGVGNTDDNRHTIFGYADNTSC